MFSYIFKNIATKMLNYDIDVEKSYEYTDYGSFLYEKSANRIKNSIHALLLVVVCIYASTIASLGAGESAFNDLAISFSIALTSGMSISDVMTMRCTVLFSRLEGKV